jgi:hypothetical protein
MSIMTFQKAEHWPKKIGLSRRLRLLRRKVFEIRRGN